MLSVLTSHFKEQKNAFSQYVSRNPKLSLSQRLYCIRILQKFTFKIRQWVNNKWWLWPGADQRGGLGPRAPPLSSWRGGAGPPLRKYIWLCVRSLVCLFVEFVSLVCVFAISKVIVYTLAPQFEVSGSDLGGAQAPVPPTWLPLGWAGPPPGRCPPPLAASLPGALWRLEREKYFFFTLNCTKWFYVDFKGIIIFFSWRKRTGYCWLFQ